MNGIGVLGKPVLEYCILPFYFLRILWRLVSWFLLSFQLLVTKKTRRILEATNIRGIKGIFDAPSWEVLEILCLLIGKRACQHLNFDVFISHFLEDTFAVVSCYSHLLNPIKKHYHSFLPL